MMHAAKALLENKGLLGDWVPNQLNVDESHKQVEIKLATLVSGGVISNTSLSDFRYVKQKRYIADYNLVQFKQMEVNECLRRATDFINAIKGIAI